MNPWAEPFERNFNEHSEQALMFINILFKQLRWTWILSLRKKAIKDCEKPLTLYKKQGTWITFRPSGRRFKEHRAARWIGFAEPATSWK